MWKTNAVLQAIKERRSIRRYAGGSIAHDLIDAVLEAGRWAPSGLNNQPWRFAIVRDAEIRAKLGSFTHYGSIIKSSSVCVAVFLHLASGYDRDKDCMGIGACVQNMLLAAHSLGLGAVWLGEILKSKGEVARLLEVPDGLELMAVIALGLPGEEPESDRLPFDTLIVRKA